MPPTRRKPVSLLEATEPHWPLSIQEEAGVNFAGMEKLYSGGGGGRLPFLAPGPLAAPPSEASQSMQATDTDPARPQEGAGTARDQTV